MEIRELNRTEYFDSIQSISHYESLKFAKKAMDWWDDYFSWKKFPCLVLLDQGKHLCYLFIHLSKDNEYLTIHNLLTPKDQRGKGHAYALLDAMMAELKYESIQRLRLSCVSSSLPFYSRLGMEYWGVNNQGHYYCDLVMPERIESIPEIFRATRTESHSDYRLAYIYEKVKNDGEYFDEKQQDVHQQCLDDLAGRYHFKALQKAVLQRGL